MRLSWCNSVHAQHKLLVIGAHCTLSKNHRQQTGLTPLDSDKPSLESDCLDATRRLYAGSCSEMRSVSAPSWMVTFFFGLCPGSVASAAVSGGGCKGGEAPVPSAGMLLCWNAMLSGGGAGMLTVLVSGRVASSLLAAGTCGWSCNVWLLSWGAGGRLLTCALSRISASDSWYS